MSINENSNWKDILYFRTGEFWANKYKDRNKMSIGGLFHSPIGVYIKDELIKMCKMLDENERIEISMHDIACDYKNLQEWYENCEE